MSFTASQKENFIAFLDSVAKKSFLELPADLAGDFLSIVIDYEIDDNMFELRVAQLFYKVPDKLDTLKDTIHDLSVIRNAMMGDGMNSLESRQITVGFFIEKIDDIFEIDFYEKEEQDSAFADEERKRRRDHKIAKRSVEIQIESLKAERQSIFDSEKEERKQRKDEKIKEQSAIQKVRQAEHDVLVEERKQRKQDIESEISSLQVELQAAHDKDVNERKERHLLKEQEAQKVHEKQSEEREEQAETRRAEKEHKEMMMRARQAELESEQLRQSSERNAKREKDEKIRQQALNAIKSTRE